MNKDEILENLILTFNCIASQSLTLSLTFTQEIYSEKKLNVTRNESHTSVHNKESIKVGLTLTESLSEEVQGKRQNKGTD